MLVTAARWNSSLTSCCSARVPGARTASGCSSGRGATKPVSAVSPAVRERERLLRCLVTAAKAAGIVAGGGEDALGRALAGADAYRSRYLPESGIEDWLVDDVDDTDEEDGERAWLDTWVAGYRWRPVGNEHLTPARPGSGAAPEAAVRCPVRSGAERSFAHAWGLRVALADTGPRRSVYLGSRPARPPPIGFRPGGSRNLL
jgi:hypothetical protein